MRREWGGIGEGLGGEVWGGFASFKGTVRTFIPFPLFIGRTAMLLLPDVVQGRVEIGGICKIISPRFFCEFIFPDGYGLSGHVHRRRNLFLFF